MQTLIDKNEALKKEIKATSKRLTALKNKPIRRVADEKKKKKSMFSSIKGLVSKEQASTGLSPKQAEAVTHIHKLLLKEAYEEADLYLDQNRKMICGKTKKGQAQPTGFQLIDEYGESVLFKAIRDSKKKQALSWIDRDAIDINVADRDGYTALMVASMFGEADIVERLVGKAHKDAKTVLYNKTALHLAAEEDQYDSCLILLDNGCDPLIEDSEGRRAYEYSKDIRTRTLITDRMKQQDADVEIEELKSDAPVEDKKRSYSQDEEMRPLFEEHDKLKKELRRLTLQFNDIKRKRTPRVDPDKLKLVPKNTSALNDRVRQLHLLVSRGNDGDALEQVEELLTEENKSLQINKDQPDELGETALMKAARLGFDEMLDMLLLYKCNTELRDESGHTALMKASHFGKKVCVEKLISDGADVDANSRKGKFTALMLAAERGHAEICEILVREGADHSMINSNGQTALDIVNSEEVKERLEKVMAENPVSRAAVQI